MSGLIGIRTRKSSPQPGPSADAGEEGESPTSADTKRHPAQAPRPAERAPLATARLGVLSLHFEAGRCRVQCPFCYLGRRQGAVEGEGGSKERTTPYVVDEGLLAVLADALERLSYRELAITLSEPVEPLTATGVLPRLLQLARRRELPAAVTTTLAVATTVPPELLAGVTRLNLSIDPFKGPSAGSLQAPVGQVAAADVATALNRVAQAFPNVERVLIATLSTQRFAEQLCDGLLADLLAIPAVDRLALNAVKPPPPWCDRAFWLRALHRLRPLLARELDRRLFLDCYVAARILGLGDCPARPDLSPAPSMASAGSAVAVSFRSCVYQPAADFTVGSADELVRRTADFVVPAVCPFPID